MDERRRSRPSGTPPPVVLVGIRCLRCLPPELLLSSCGESAFKSGLVALQLSCNLCGREGFSMMEWESLLVLIWA